MGRPSSTWPGRGIDCSAARRLSPRCFMPEDEREPICLFGFGVAVHDDFIAEIKKLPSFWVGPEITRRLIKGESPVLTDKQLRKANSWDGMNLLIWEGCARAG